METENFTESIPKTNEVFFHRKVINNLKQLKNMLFFLIGWVFALRIVYLVQFINNYKESSDYLLILNVIFSILIIIYGIYLIYISSMDKFDNYLKFTTYVPLILQFLVSLFTFIKLTGIDDPNYGYSFISSFSFLLFVYFFLFLFIRVSIKIKDFYSIKSNLIYLTSICTLLTIIAIEFFKMLGIIIEYYTIETVTDQIENLVGFSVLAFIVIAGGFLYTIMVYYPNSKNNIKSKQLQKYSSILPFITMGVVFIILLLFEDEINLESHSVIYLIYLITAFIISILLIAQEFLKNSYSTLSRGFYRLFRDFHLFNFKILRKYNRKIKQTGEKIPDDDIIKRNRLYVYFFKIFQVFISIIIFWTIASYAVFTTYIFSGAMWGSMKFWDALFPGELMEKMIEDYGLFTGSSFISIILICTIGFFVYAPLINMIFIFILELIGALVKKIFRVVFVEVKGEEEVMDK